MRKAGVRALLLVPALMALAVGAAVAVQTSASAQSNVAQAAALDPEDVKHCSGGPQLHTQVDIKDAPETIGENGAFVQVSDASIPFTVPAAAVTNQVILIFTGEAALHGQPNVFNAVVDSLQIRLLIDNAVQPPGAVVFTTDVGESVALQTCALVGPGNHTARVEWLLVDVGMNSGLTGTLGSWEFHLEQNAP